jgi:predicted nucleotidyltransferase
MIVTTISERKKTEVERRIRAASQVADDLRRYVRSRHGRFVLFGSFVSGRMRYDSDLDVVVDFPRDAAAEAWRYVEDVCRQAEIEPDIHDAATSRPDFLKRVLSEGLVLE